MKNLLKISVIITIVLGITLQLQAQRDFSGEIEYKITYTDADIDPAHMAMLPRTISVVIDGNKSRTEQQQGVMSIVQINDADNFTSIVLMDIMGMKYAIRTTKEEIEEGMAEMPKPEITFTDETKTIAGYEGQKAILKYTDEEGNVTTEEVYYTTDIGGGNINFATPYHGIPGFLLQYTTENEMFKSTIKVESIESKRRIRPAIFMIPEDYKLVSPEELQEIFEGMQ